MTTALKIEPELRRLPITRNQSAHLAALDVKATQAQNELSVALRMVIAQHDLEGDWLVVRLESDALIVEPRGDLRLG